MGDAAWAWLPLQLETRRGLGPLLKRVTKHRLDPFSELSESRVHAPLLLPKDRRGHALIMERGGRYVPDRSCRWRGGVRLALFWSRMEGVGLAPYWIWRREVILSPLETDDTAWTWPLLGVAGESCTCTPLAVGEAYSFVACLSRMTIDHASLARRSTVPTLKRHLQHVGILPYIPYITQERFTLYISYPRPVSPSVATICLLV